MQTGSLRTHGTWQEAAGIGLGVLTMLSPWVTGQTGYQNIVLATAAAGIVVLLLSAVKLMSLTRSQQAAVMLAGLWLCIGPFLFAYAGSLLGLAHFVLGPVIAALGALELWQDWHKTDEEMTHYGSGPRHSHGYKPLKV